MTGAPAIPWPNGAPDLRISVGGGLGAPAAARQATRAWLDHHLEGAGVEDVLILISELVTNAVRHAGAGADDVIVVELAAGPGVLYGAVADTGPGFVAPAEPAPHPEGGGFGLVLLHQLTRRWTVSSGPGARVWFEFARA